MRFFYVLTSLYLVTFYNCNKQLAETIMLNDKIILSLIPFKSTSCIKTSMTYNIRDGE